MYDHGRTKILSSAEITLVSSGVYTTDRMPRNWSDKIAFDSIEGLLLELGG